MYSKPRKGIGCTHGRIPRIKGLEVAETEVETGDVLKLNVQEDFLKYKWNVEKRNDNLILMERIKNVEIMRVKRTSRHWRTFERDSGRENQEIVNSTALWVFHG